MAFQRYDSYKPARNPWLLEVPSHWKLLPGLAVLRANKDRNIGMIEETVLSLSYGKVIIKPPEKLTGLVPESFETYQIINPNDIIIRPTDLQNDHTSLRTGLAKDRGIITSAYICLRPDPMQNPVFVHYLLHSYDLLKVYYGMGSGLRQNLDFRDFKRLELCIPPRVEQDSIANFLDQKTAEIDEAIAKKRRLIELLKEQKAILINQAVTKGLNPDVPMRDSGVEWIGEVPRHWEVKRVKNVSSFITSGPRGWAEYFSDEGAVFLQSGNLTNSVSIDLYSANRVMPPRGTEGRRTRLKSKDVLVCITGANTGRVALAAGIEREEVYINQHLCLIRPRENVYANYLSYCLHSNVGKMYFFLRQYGLKEGLGLDDIKNAPVLLPPIDEQKLIASRVDSIISLSDQAIMGIIGHIDALNKYKSTLIAETVTGKIKITEPPLTPTLSH